MSSAFYQQRYAIFHRDFRKSNASFFFSSFSEGGREVSKARQTGSQDRDRFFLQEFHATGIIGTEIAEKEVERGSRLDRQRH